MIFTERLGEYASNVNIDQEQKQLLSSKGLDILRISQNSQESNPDGVLFW